MHLVDDTNLKSRGNIFWSRDLIAESQDSWSASWLDFVINTDVFITKMSIRVNKMSEVNYFFES